MSNCYIGSVILFPHEIPKIQNSWFSMKTNKILCLGHHFIITILLTPVYWPQFIVGILLSRFYCRHFIIVILLSPFYCSHFIVTNWLSPFDCSQLIVSIILSAFHGRQFIVAILLTPFLTGTNEKVSSFNTKIIKIGEK